MGPLIAERRPDQGVVVWLRGLARQRFDVVGAKPGRVGSPIGLAHRSSGRIRPDDIAYKARQLRTWLHEVQPRAGAWIVRQLESVATK